MVVSLFLDVRSSVSDVLGAVYGSPWHFLRSPAFSPKTLVPIWLGCFTDRAARTKGALGAR